jgi:hypothetical protein
MAKRGPHEGGPDSKHVCSVRSRLRGNNGALAQTHDARTTGTGPAHSPAGGPGLGAFFNSEDAATVAAFTERLVPGAPGKPGARDADVLNYIDLALAGAYADLQYSILSAPAFLSGLNDEGVGRIRDAALRTLHPAEILEIAALEEAEKVARDAVKIAEERIATRAGLRKSMGGDWQHVSETTPVAPTPTKQAA